MELLVRVVDAADNILVNGICCEVQYNEAIEAVFGSLKVDGRLLQAVRLLQLANAPIQSAVQVPSTHTCERAMQFCHNVGIPLPSVIVMTAGSKPTSLVGPPRELHNAFRAIMAGLKQLYHYSNYLSREDMARAFSEGTSNGQLAQHVAAHLQDSDAGFSSGTSSRVRKNVLIAVNMVFYSVTPRMVNSFLRDLQGCTDVVKFGFQDVKHLLGCERTVEGPADGARDELERALNALLRQNLS
jgi:hypothetical protein